MEKILVLGIAKGKGRVRATETIYTNKGVIEIDPHSESFKLLSEIRDESHRFAISASRKKIRKTVSNTQFCVLSTIPVGNFAQSFI